MTLREQFYSALVLIITIFLLLGMGTMYFLVLPMAEGQMIRYYYYTIGICGVAFFLLTVTLVINFSRQSLSVVPTMVQCAVLTCLIYAIPLAIWGVVLLRTRLQSESLDASSPGILESDIFEY